MNLNLLLAFSMSVYTGKQCFITIMYPSEVYGRRGCESRDPAPRRYPSVIPKVISENERNGAREKSLDIIHNTEIMESQFDGGRQ